MMRLLDAAILALLLTAVAADFVSPKTGLILMLVLCIVTLVLKAFAELIERFNKAMRG